MENYYGLTKVTKFVETMVLFVKTNPTIITTNLQCNMFTVLRCFLADFLIFKIVYLSFIY